MHLTGLWQGSEESERALVRRSLKADGTKTATQICQYPKCWNLENVMSHGKKSSQMELSLRS